MKNASLESFISIQDVHSASKMPEWLSVLPVLVDTSMNLAWRGPSCLSKLITIDLPIEHLRRLTKKKSNKFVSAE